MNPDEHANLGHLLGEFGWNQGRARAVLWIWLFLLVPSLLFSLFVIGIPGLILSIYFIYRSLKRLRAKQPAILAYEQGLVDQRKATPQVIRYKDTEAVYLSAIVTNGVLNYVLTLKTQNGQKVKIDEHIANVDGLKKIVDEQMVREKLPAILAQYHQGSPIVFDALQITQAGLSMGKKMLPWSDFESADIQRPANTVYLSIRQKDGKKEWGVQSRDSFPNLALFFALIDHIQTAQRP